MIPDQPANNTPAPPENSLIISFMTLRQAVGILGISLPIVLIIGSLILDHPSQIQISISAYYHTCMRNALVGILCGTALFLLSYHGYEWQDFVSSKLAGLFALCIAFFPTSETTNKGDIISTLHYIFAGCFFVVLSYMSIFLFTKTSGNMTPQKKIRNRIYVICGIVMLTCVAGIPLDGIQAIHDEIIFLKPTLILEALALFAFGFSWLTKGEFLLKDQ